MLRNTTASKATIGPLNTLDSKTIAVLAPREELIIANSKIK